MTVNATLGREIQRADRGPIVERYEDGSQLWQNQLVAKNVPSTVAIQLVVVTGGVTFDDLTLQRWIGVGDLSDIGEYYFRMIRPASVGSSTCHSIKAYQDGVLLGEAYYSGYPVPDPE